MSINCFCNLFKPITPDDTYLNKIEGITVDTNGNLFIYAKDYETNTSTTNFKNKLAELYNAGNPMKLYYPLATPTTTEVTDTNLIAQLETLLNVMTYKEVTNITSTSTDDLEKLDLNLHVDYFKSNLIRLQKGEKTIDELSKTTITSQVSDTWEVADKTSKAPSIRLVEENNKTVDLTTQITNTHSSISSSSSFKLLKYGNLVSLSFDISRSGNFTNGDILCILPESVRPTGAVYMHIAGAGHTVRTVIIKPNGSVTMGQVVENTNWIGGSITWII